jgi:hypothetical protein
MMQTITRAITRVGKKLKINLWGQRAANSLKSYIVTFQLRVSAIDAADDASFQLSEKNRIKEFQGGAENVNRKN